MLRLRIIIHAFSNDAKDIWCKAWLVINCIIIVVIMSGMITNAMAQEHLTPDIPFVISIDDYSIQLKDIFSEGLKEEVLLRALVLASFSPEYMTGIQKAGESYEAFLIESCSTIWKDDDSSNDHNIRDSKYNVDKVQNDTNLCKDSADGKVKKSRMFKKKITKQLASRLVEIWKESLLGVKHVANPPLMLDGTYFHLSMFLHGYGDISGILIPVEKDSKMEALSNFIVSLANYSRDEFDDIVLGNYLKSFEDKNWKNAE